MKHKVKRKQQNSSMCLVCGMNNPFGLKTSFFEIDSNELVAIFTPREIHQGYPGRLHGGISTAILDETIGRAINAVKEKMVWGVTIEFTARFRKPVPLDAELKVIGRITEDNYRFFEGTGEIVLPNGVIAVSGTGKYMKMPIEKIADFDNAEQNWNIIENENDPKEIEL